MLLLVHRKDGKNEKEEKAAWRRAVRTCRKDLVIRNLEIFPRKTTVDELCLGPHHYHVSGFL